MPFHRRTVLIVHPPDNGIEDVVILLGVSKQWMPNTLTQRFDEKARRREVHDVDEERPDPARQENGAKGRDEIIDLRLTLEQAIEEVLDPREALAVRLIYFEGHTYRDVGDAIGMSVGAVSGMVYRALSKLREVGGIARETQEGAR